MQPRLVAAVRQELESFTSKSLAEEEWANLDVSIDVSESDKDPFEILSLVP